MSGPKLKPDWPMWFIYSGCALGLAFILFFVRMPRWVGDGRLAGVVGLVYFAVFALGGGYLGYRFYQRYGCGLGLHIWQEDRLPRTRECLLCGRFQRPVDPFQEDSDWKDVYLTRDESTGRFAFRDVEAPLDRSREKLIRGKPLS